MENAAVALTDGVDLILQPGRRCQDGKPGPVREPDFQKFATCAPQAWPFWQPHTRRVKRKCPTRRTRWPTRAPTALRFIGTKAPRTVRRDALRHSRNAEASPSAWRCPGNELIGYGRRHDCHTEPTQIPGGPRSIGGRAGHRIMAAQPWIRRASAGSWPRACTRHSSAPPRGLRSAPARRVPGASRPVDLHRCVRAGLPSCRQERVSHRRDHARQGAGRPHHAVSGRQFRVRLQLARRCRTEEQAANRARTRVEFARDESIRHE